jgi:hypothetical protein
MRTNNNHLHLLSALIRNPLFISTDANVNNKIYYLQMQINLNLIFIHKLGNIYYSN